MVVSQRSVLNYKKRCLSLVSQKRVMEDSLLVLLGKYGKNRLDIISNKFLIIKESFSLLSNLYLSLLLL